MAHTLSALIAAGGLTLTGKKGQLTARERYEQWLTTDSDNPTKASILATTGYPIPFVTVSEFGTCVSSECVQVPNKKRLFKVTSEFSSDIDSENDATTSPTTWVPRRETFLEPYTEVEFTDKDSKAYTNGAGVPFASAPAVDKDAIRWDFFQFDPVTGVGAVDDDDIADRNNTINDASYLGRAKHTLLLKIRKSVVGTWYKTNLRLTEYSLIWKASDWNEKMGNVGNSFCIGGQMYPYRYYVLDNAGAFDPKASQAVHTGPLGNRNVPYNTAFIANAGGAGPLVPADVKDDGPSGGAVYEASTKSWYAETPPANTMFYISRRKFGELHFDDILRF